MSDYAPVIDVSALDPSEGFRIDGTGGSSGLSVSFAGDVNGDGVGDLLIGGPLSDTAYVVFGQAGPVSGGVFSLGDLDGANGFAMTGDGAGADTGWSVSSAGDVNGDGFADFVVGAHYADPGAVGNAGSAYVVFGKGTAFASTLDLTALDGSDGFRIDGDDANQRAGTSVASAGDFNGDGIGDLIIGGPGAFNSTSWTGQSYVLFGTTGGFAADIGVSQLNGTNGFQLIGQAGDLAGFSVDSAGDLNHDGFDDLLVGAPQTDSDVGKAYVVFGHAGAVTTPLDVTALDGADGFAIEGTGSGIGTSVSSAGDFNGDGIADMVIGAQGSSAAYVVFGKQGGFGATLDLSALSSADGFRMDGPVNTGVSVTQAGDVNGDGFDDLVVGGGSSYGSAYVLFGRANGFSAPLDLASLDGDDGFRIDSPHLNDDFAHSVSAGDVNGDGLSDIIVGAWGSDLAGGGAGSTYVIYGSLPGESVHRRGTGIDQTIQGSDFNDVLSGRGGRDHLLGHDGADRLMGGPGGDTIDGGAGNDTAVYSNATGAVSVDLDLGAASGADGSDTLISIESVVGGRFGDTLTGTSTANRMFGGDGDDTILAGAGDDVIKAGAGNDSISAGPGNDTLSYLDLSEAVTVDLGLGLTTATGKTDHVSGVENVTGTTLGDHLIGNGQGNALMGGKGADLIEGGLGLDILVGSSGHDTLIGGKGGDILRGGGGADTYIFDTVADSAIGDPDMASEFEMRDRIDLHRIDADITTDGNQHFTLVGAFSHHAGELTVSFNSGTFETTVEGDIDGDGVADLEILLFDSNGSDFGSFANFVL